MTSIDTVLVAFRSEEVIDGAIERGEALGGDIVVVEHGDGESAGRARAAGATVVEDRTNPGFGAGQNRGVALTSTPYVLLCNPDTELRPKAVAAGATLLDARPDVAMVQGVIVNQTTGLPERSAGVELGPMHLVGRALGARRLLGRPGALALAARIPRLHDHAQRVPTSPTEVESLAATAVLVRRSAFEAVGGFDESYFLYGEDLDLCRRLRVTGWKIVTVPDVWATHCSGGSAESARRRDVEWWRGTMQFGATWWSRRAWTVAIAVAGLRWFQLALLHPGGAGSSLQAMVFDPVASRRSRGRRGGQISVDAGGAQPRDL